MEKKDYMKRMENIHISSVHVYQGTIVTARVQRRTWRRYAVCRISSGKGVLKLDHAVHLVSENDWFIFEPGMYMEIETNGEAPLRYQIILFSYVGLVRQQAAWRTEMFDFPVTGKLQLSESTREVQQMLDQLVHFTPRFRELENIETKQRLHRLLIRLIRNVKSNAAPQAGMDQVLNYMTHHYMKEIRIEQLAAMAGLSVNHFTRTFKREFHMTPVEYLMQQRISKAKQLLFSTEKIRVIAERVGYKDEHYFSRVFKKREGIAPTLYMKNKISRIAALYYGLDDAVMTLGLEPVSALSYEQRVGSHPSVVESQAFRHSGLMLSSLNQNFDRLKGVQPDLIITSDRMQLDHSLQHIAPTAILKHTNDIANSLLYMADVMGRSEQAVRWIEQHAELSRVLQADLRSRWGKQRVMFIRITAHFTRIYGKHNQVGALLYEDLGFLMPAHFPEGEWAIELHEGELPLYDTDHLFVMIDPTAEAYARWRQLQQSSEWTGFTAVQLGHVHDAGDIFFRALGPAGRLWSMRYVAGMLGVKVR
ncbi:AraC-like DNA-binding protein [Paenibacillus sp. JGP012]|uniref:helix-turn-helix domain-containing protein n=1 Tax=Paenibacillus sp. JGP012 TaxID=2735914 RepID=UPI001615F66F|nr:helix-turn-helix domain-containing protein [Paenibacillus sp. JGP012]MBB6019092.1 AraC-like DNA-binding protein [Paenibacillus sp. JGP012]